MPHITDQEFESLNQAARQGNAAVLEVKRQAAIINELADALIERNVALERVAIARLILQALCYKWDTTGNNMSEVVEEARKWLKEK